MALTLVSTLTSSVINSPLLILDGKQAIVGHTSNNTLSVIDIEDPRNPSIKSTTSAISNMIPRDGLRIDDSYWITSGALNANGTIFEMTLNNAQTRSSITNQALSNGWKFSGHNDGYSAVFKNYLYIPARNEGGSVIGIVDYTSRTFAGSFVPTALEPKVTRVYGCYLFVGSELSPEFAVYDLSSTPLSPTLVGSVTGAVSDDIGPVNDMLIHPDNGYVYTVADYLAYGGGFNHDYEMQSILITDPESPSLIDGYDDPSKMDVAQSFTKIGERLFTAVDNYDAVIQVEIENFSDLPQFETELQDNTNLAGAQAIDTDGKYLYVAGNGVFSILDAGITDPTSKYYRPVKVVGYNVDPPPDDGTEEGNFVRFYRQQRRLLFDPIKDATVLMDKRANRAIEKMFRRVGRTAFSPCFFAYLSENQDGIESETWTKIEFDLEEFDIADDFDVERFRWTPSERGKYLTGGFYVLDPDSTGSGIRQIKYSLYKNGELFRYLEDSGHKQTGDSYPLFSESGCVLVEADGCGDFFELFLWHNTPNRTEQIFGGDSSETNFWGVRVQ